MAKIIVSCRFKKNAKGVKNLIKYMGTRESVEKLPSAREYDLASLSQVRLIRSVTNHFPQSKTFLEYTDYKMLPTRQNAHEFLDAVAERYADCADELKGLVGYISQRPGVEKLGKHGLFSQFDLPIDLDEVAKNVSEHNGIIWTEVVSLRREDAERLHYNNAEAWKNLVRRNMNEIARAHRIQPKDLHWYAAFHNTTHHPHIHLIVYSTGTEGYLSEKGIRQLRKAFGFEGTPLRFTLREKKREELFATICEAAVSYGVAFASVEEIEALNILNATYLAMNRAIGQLSPQPDLALIDGNRNAGISVNSRCVVKGDARCADIAAASILAKVTRDRLMLSLAEEYPQYRFEQHKGYGTALHYEALRKYGPSPVHRMSFLRKMH